MNEADCTFGQVSPAQAHDQVNRAQRNRAKGTKKGTRQACSYDPCRTVTVMGRKSDSSYLVYKYQLENGIRFRELCHLARLGPDWKGAMLSLA